MMKLREPCMNISFTFRISNWKLLRLNNTTMAPNFIQNNNPATSNLGGSDVFIKVLQRLTSRSIEVNC